MAVTIPVVTTAGRVVLRALLVPFAVIAGYFVAWGIVFCMDAIIRAFFGTVTGAIGWIPYAGRVITSPLHAIEHKLTSFLGGLEAHFEHQMATRWHTLAQLVEGYAAAIREDAIWDWHLARKIADVYGQAASGKLGARFQKWVEAELAKLHGVRTIIVHTVKVIEHPTVGKIGGAISTGVKPFARALERVIEWDLPHIRARERALADEIGRLWRLAHRRVPVVAASVALGALVFALGRLGLGWLRCSKVGRLGRATCGLNDNLLESLLAGATVVAGSVSIVALAKACQEITGACEDGVGFFVREVK